MKTVNKLEVKIISIFTLLLLIGFVINSFIQYSDYKSTEERYNRLEKSMEKQLDTYIESILYENQRKGEVNIEFFTNLIHEELLREYDNDLDALEKDILNPVENSDLVILLDDILEDVFINENTNHNKPFVASLNNIIWNRVLPYKYDNNDIVSWNSFISKHFNPSLSKIAMEAITNMNTNKFDFIFWEAIENKNPDHKKINTMNINEVLKVFKEEGIDGLKSYEILVPVYITKSGDIFGTKDVNTMGHKIENYKIIVIQRINMYDALQPYLSSINLFENDIIKLQEESSLIMNEILIRMIESILLSVIVLYGSAVIQRRFNK